MKETKAPRQFGGAAYAAGVMAAALLLFFGVRMAIELSPFVVDSIEVKGNSFTKTEEIVAATGLIRGESLYQKDLKSIREDVEKLPWVEKVNISRRLPGNINIEVEETRPSFLIRLGERLYYLSTAGKVIDAPLKAGIDFPVVTGLDWPDIEGDPDLRTQLLDILKNINPEDFGGRIEEIHRRKGDDFVIYGNFPNPSRVIIGQGDMADKFKSLGRLTKTLKKRGQYAKTADFTLEDRIIARLEPLGEQRGTK